MDAISQYVDWEGLWTEVSLIGGLNPLDEEQLTVLDKFLKEKDLVTLDASECGIFDDKVTFVFSEQGGENESDLVGWSREYWFTVVPEEDFMIIDCGYEQG